MEFSPKQTFSPQELALLDLVYEEAWTRLRKRRPSGHDEEVSKEVLRRKIVAIARCGGTDPEMLRDMALDMMPRQQARQR